MAFVFVSFTGGVVCGNYDSMSTDSLLLPTDNTFPLPVFFEFDAEGDYFSGVRVATLDYAF